MATPGPVLTIEHELECPPAWVGEWLTDEGLTLQLCRPYAGDPVPDALDGYGALLVLGGAMGAGDDGSHPWLTDTKTLLRTAVDSRLPTLGICLGHQLAAVALGGRVAKSTSGRQRGLRGVGWTPAAHADPLFAPLVGGAVAVHWNDDVVVDLPPGCRVLARTADGSPQAIRFAPAVWGVQFHPEVGSEIFALWGETDREGPVDGAGVDVAVEAVAAAEAELRTTWRQMVRGFAGVVTAT